MPETITPSTRKNSAALAVSTRIDVGGQRVRRVLLLDVGKHANAFGANSATISKQASRARFDDPLVCHMREDETLDAYEARTARQGHGQGAVIRSGEHLDAERQWHGAPHFVTDDRERGHNLRANRALEIWPIVRVLDDHTVETGRRVHARLGDRSLDNLIDALSARRRARKPSRVKDADERARNTEERVDDA